MKATPALQQLPQLIADGKISRLRTDRGCIEPKVNNLITGGRCQAAWYRFFTSHVGLQPLEAVMKPSSHLLRGFGLRLEAWFTLARIVQGHRLRVTECACSAGSLPYQINSVGT